MLSLDFDGWEVHRERNDLTVALNLQKILGQNRSFIIATTFFWWRKRFIYYVIMIYAN